MLMRCLVGHGWSPGIEKAPDEGALWVCGIGARNRLLATMNDFGRLLRSSENSCNITILQPVVVVKQII
jgi:hypothetical protein